jgi:hypothetical protein
MASLLKVEVIIHGKKHACFKKIRIYTTTLPDVVEASKWYVEYLGFQCDPPKANSDMCFMGLPEGGLIILNQAKTPNDCRRYCNTSGFFFKTDQIEDFRDYFQLNNIEIIDYVDNGFKFLTFRDPYGNVLGIIQDENKYEEMADEFKRAVNRDLSQEEEKWLSHFCKMKEWDTQDTIINLLKEINKKREK